MRHLSRESALSEGYKKAGGALHPVTPFSSLPPSPPPQAYVLPPSLHPLVALNSLARRLLFVNTFVDTFLYFLPRQ